MCFLMIDFIMLCVERDGFSFIFSGCMHGNFYVIDVPSPGVQISFYVNRQKVE